MTKKRKSHSSRSKSVSPSRKRVLLPEFEAMMAQPPGNDIQAALNEDRGITQNDELPGPIAMLGYARKLRAGPARRTSAWMREIREGESSGTAGVIVTAKPPGIPKVTSKQIYAVEKSDPLVAVANQPPISAREFAAFSRALEEGRRQNRFGGLSRAHARPLLRILMEHISEESFNAGWGTDLEFRLWEDSQKTADRSLRPYEREGLRFLSGAACGWWTFDRFVSTKRWRILYEAHRVAAKPIAKHGLITGKARSAARQECSDA